MMPSKQFSGCAVRLAVLLVCSASLAAALDIGTAVNSLAPTRQRAELNPALSALIGHDVRRSIEAKRDTQAVLTTTGRPPVADALTAAGTAHQKSRVKVQPGPNGEDYEYEFVYYYYDDEADAPADEPATSTAPAKTRYTQLDRHPGEPAARPAARSNDDTPDDRLPQHTRFPPRASTAPPDEPARAKAPAVRRPSLELVDSQSFNRDDQTKASKLQQQQRQADSEQRHRTSTTEEPTSTTGASAMDKVAFDLYALVSSGAETTLAPDEPFATTQPTDAPDADTETDATEWPTELPEATTPTTTSTTSTTTSTTTTPVPTVASTTVNGRKSPFARNRFRLKNADGPVTAVAEAPAVDAPAPVRRFGGRPAGGARRATTSSTTEAPADGTTVGVPVGPALAGTRGRTRNRFVRPHSDASVGAPAADNSARPSTGDDEPPTSTVRPSLRASRPSGAFPVRSRVRPGPATSSTTETASVGTPTDDVEPANGVPAVLPRPGANRFNLQRPANRSPAGRLRGSTTTAVPSTTAAPAPATAEPPADAEAAANGADNAPKGLNRLKQRPRIAVKPATAGPATPVRKINPLIARRKLNGAATTLAASTTESPSADNGGDLPPVDGTDPDTEVTADAPDATTPQTPAAAAAAVEPSSEQPRGLGLLANRRRLPLRRPGTSL